jgi:arylsulfatase
MGAITEFATSAPGNNSMKPNTCAALAETLKLNGYSTAQFGKCTKCRCGRAARSGRSITGPPAAEASSISKASSAGNPTSTIRTCSRERRGRAGRRPNKATRSTRIWPTTPSVGCGSRKALPRTSHFFVYSRPGANARPNHVPKEWADKVQGEVRPGLGQAARETLRARRSSASFPRTVA